MNELRGRRVHDFEKPIPGCMGKLVGLFDLNTAMAGNRLLMDRAYRDASPPNRGRLHATKKVLDRNDNHLEDKQIINELKRSSSSKKSNGTPMKMLIAQEMSNEESKQKPPSVIARLMGLDGLPAQPISTLKKSSSESYLRNATSKPGSVQRHQQQDNGFQDKHHHSHSYAQEQPELKDVYENWQQSTKISLVKDQLPQKSRLSENSNERKMALVRQKFIEAKRLATDDKLRQSKEFQDALEVLSSNRELFLKFLQEPNSLISKHLYALQSIPPPPQSKRITILKPSKTLETDRGIGLEMKCAKQIKKQPPSVQLNEWENNEHSWVSAFAHQKTDSSSQPTRIVVLKPGPGKRHDIKTVGSPTSLPTLPYGRDFCEESGTDAGKGSREIANEIAMQMQDCLSSNRKDESFLPSILSNGNFRDESSFNRSENRYFEEGNLSDSEIMTPTSRHSWDYINRYDSPYSTSSLSRVSYSSESSVTREAKKRLSERWAIMTSTRSNEEQRQVRRSSSTLGEMLALSDMKPVKSIGEGKIGEHSVSNSRSCGEEQELRGPITCLSSLVDKGQGGNHSPMNLSRSRSVPVSSTAYENVGLKIEVSDPRVRKSIVPKEATKPKSGKSLKGKVSSLFFYRNKKSNNEKSGLSSPVSSLVVSDPCSAELQVTPDVEQLSSVQRSDANFKGGTNCSLEEAKSTNLVESSCRTSVVSVGPTEQTCDSEAPENLVESQDQPSPISVLQAPFEDDANTPQSSENANGDHQELHAYRKSESTAKSLIESVTCSLLWDECASSEMTTSLVPEPSTISSKAEEEEQWFSFIQAFLSLAGLDHERADTIFSRWHSPDSPLDPTLLNKCMDKEDVKHLNEAKRRQWRSELRLQFDCVNVALMDMMRCRLDGNPLKTSYHKWVVPGASVTEEVSIRVREWFYCRAKWFSNEVDTSLLIDGEVREEVVGRGWVELMELEVEGLVKEIEKKILKELVEEALADLTCGWL